MPWVSIITPGEFDRIVLMPGGNRQILTPRMVRPSLVRDSQGNFVTTAGARRDSWDFNTDTLESRVTLAGGPSSMPTRKSIPVLLAYLAKVALCKDTYFELVIQKFEQSKVPFESLRKAVNLGLLSNPFRVYEYDGFLKDIMYDITWQHDEEFSSTYIVFLAALHSGRVPPEKMIPPALRARMKRGIKQGGGSSREFLEVVNQLPEPWRTNVAQMINLMLSDANGMLSPMPVTAAARDRLFTEMRGPFANAILKGFGLPARSFRELMTNLHDSMRLVGGQIQDAGFKIYKEEADKKARELAVFLGWMSDIPKKATEGWGKGWHGDSLGHSEARRFGAEAKWIPGKPTEYRKKRDTERRKLKQAKWEEMNKHRACAGCGKPLGREAFLAFFHNGTCYRKYKARAAKAKLVVKNKKVF